MLSDLRARSLPPLRRQRALIPSALASCLLAAPVLLAGTPVKAQQAGYGQTLGTSPMERQMYDGGTGRPNGGSILDSTNPIDLMNKLRRSTAMDDATPPASAIDQALQQLEIQSKPAGASAGQAATAGVSGSSQPAAAPLWSPTAPTAATPSAQPGSTPQRQSL